MNEILAMTKSDDSYSADCFQFMSMLFLTIMLGTYVLAYKMISINGYIISAGIFIFPINYAITDITTEVYGYEHTKKLLKYVFICCLFFSVVVPLLAVISPPENWSYQTGYTHVLGNVFRFFIANTIGIAIGITLNSYLIAKLKIMMRGKHFWLRSIGASSLGELITSIIADIIAFVGTTNMKGVFNLMIGIFAVKLLYSILLSLPNTLIVMHLKLKTGIKPNDFTLDLFNQSKNEMGEPDAIKY